MGVNQSGFSSNKNPQTTSWEEHGAVADRSDGRRLKWVQSVPSKLIIDDTDPDNIYVGETLPGLGTDVAYWRIRKIITSGSIISILFATGKDSFESVWDNRAALSYS